MVLCVKEFAQHSQLLHTPSELPSLIFLHNERIFRYQGELSSANLMRSYALQGFHNQGMGEAILDSSYWLLVKTKYINWLFNYSATGSSGNINVTALVLTGFVLGVAVCALIAMIVVLRFKEEDDEATTNKRKKKKKQ